MQSLWACGEAVLYIFTSTKISHPLAHLLPLLLLVCYIPGEQTCLGGNILSLAAQFFRNPDSTHPLTATRKEPGLGRDLAEKGGEMKLGVTLMVENLFSIMKNSQTATQIPAQSKPSFSTVILPFLPSQLLSL